jgi:hypothetical protein
MLFQVNTHKQLSKINVDETLMHATIRVAEHLKYQLRKLIGSYCLTVEVSDVSA